MQFGFVMVVEIVALAVAEEMFKTLLCRAISWRRLWLIPALAFAAFEAVVKLHFLLELPSDFVDSDQKWRFAIFAAVGTSIFHFYSSLLYLSTRLLWLALAVGSVVHFAYNVAVKFDNTFYVLDFTSVIWGWAYTSFCGLVFLLYFKWENTFMK